MSKLTSTFLWNIKGIDCIWNTNHSNWDFCKYPQGFQTVRRLPGDVCRGDKDSKLFFVVWTDHLSVPQHCDCDAQIMEEINDISSYFPLMLTQRILVVLIENVICSLVVQTLTFRQTELVLGLQYIHPLRLISVLPQCIQTDADFLL